LHGFSGPLGLKWEFWGQNRERGGAMLTPNELVLPFVGSYVCAIFGENRSRNATVRVLADGQTLEALRNALYKCSTYLLTYLQTDRQIHTVTDANRFYNLSHAICYGADNKSVQNGLNSPSLTVYGNELRLQNYSPSKRNYAKSAMRCTDIKQLCRCPPRTC